MPNYFESDNGYVDEIFDVTPAISTGSRAYASTYALFNIDPSALLYLISFHIWNRANRNQNDQGLLKLNLPVAAQESINIISTYAVADDFGLSEINLNNLFDELDFFDDTLGFLSSGDLSTETDSSSGLPMEYVIISGDDFDIDNLVSAVLKTIVTHVSISEQLSEQGAKGIELPSNILTGNSTNMNPGLYYRFAVNIYRDIAYSLGLPVREEIASPLSPISVDCWDDQMLFEEFEALAKDARDLQKRLLKARKTGNSLTAKFTFRGTADHSRIYEKTLTQITPLLNMFYRDHIEGLEPATSIEEMFAKRKEARESELFERLKNPSTTVIKVNFREKRTLGKFVLSNPIVL